MGEPSFNPAVLEALNQLPGKYTWNEFIPSLSTIAPVGTGKFFDRLIEIKKEKYPYTFQLQFSLHSTSPEQRDLWMPVRKWSFQQMAEYGSRFHDDGGQKITLNFAVSTESIIDPRVLREYFSPALFIIKLTPVNPTYKAQQNQIESALSGMEQIGLELVDNLKAMGYEVIVSIGEMEENRIGSNCGQYLQAYLKNCEKLPGAYSYGVV